MTAPSAVGATVTPREIGPITMTDIVRYQGASGDLNPMHHDDTMAQAAGYPAAFSVGMLGAGQLAALCTDVYGVASVRRFRTRFRGLVWRGDVLTASAVVTAVVEVDGERRVCLDLQLVRQTGAVAIDGSAEFALDGPFAATNSCREPLR